jgi:hypothetical protein
MTTTTRHASISERPETANERLTTAGIRAPLQGQLGLAPAYIQKTAWPMPRMLRAIPPLATS